MNETLINAFFLTAIVILFTSALRSVKGMSEAQSKALGEAIRALSQLKGLTPHQAAPEKVAPNGVPFEEIEKQQRVSVDAQVAAGRARERRHLEDARRAFMMRGNKGKVAEVDEMLKKLEEAS